MLASKYTRSHIIKKALHAEFYTLDPSEELWADALRLHWAIENNDQNLADCIIDKYGCVEPDNLGGDTSSCDFTVGVTELTEDGEACKDLIVNAE